jgi:hypothetical protein
MGAAWHDYVWKDMLLELRSGGLPRLQSAAAGGRLGACACLSFGLSDAQVHTQTILPIPHCGRPAFAMEGFEQALRERQLHSVASGTSPGSYR